MTGSVDDILEHHGVKGMKWGRRKSDSGPTDVSVIARPGKRGLKTSGGEGHSPSEDAVLTAVGRQLAKKSGVHTLTNKELKLVVERMNLERQYRSLSADAAGPGVKFLSKLLTDTGKQHISTLVNEQAKKATKKV